MGGTPDREDVARPRDEGLVELDYQRLGVDRGEVVGGGRAFGHTRRRRVSGEQVHKRPRGRSIEFGAAVGVDRKRNRIHRQVVSHRLDCVVEAVEVEEERIVA